MDASGADLLDAAGAHRPPLCGAARLQRCHRTLRSLCLRVSGEVAPSAPRPALPHGCGISPTASATTVGRRCRGRVKRARARSRQVHAVHPSRRATASSGTASQRAWPPRCSSARHWCGSYELGSGRAHEIHRPPGELRRTFGVREVPNAGHRDQPRGRHGLDRRAWRGRTAARCRLRPRPPGSACPRRGRPGRAWSRAGPASR